MSIFPFHRIIVAIIDSFHFELDQPTSADVNNDNLKHRSILDSIARDFVPEIQNCLIKRTSTDVAHKSMQKYFYDEDEEILRVPLALALVKLLQKLGRQFLETNLSK